jgi:hypothetical protein
MTDATLEQLSRRVKELEDREAIRDVIWLYSFLLDTGQWDRIAAEVFAEDGVDVHAERTNPPFVSKGRTALKAFFNMTMPNFDGTQHFLGPSVIEMDGDRAHAKTYALCSHWMRHGEGAGDVRPADSIMAICYDDELVRAPEGWRISYRRLHPFGPGSSLAVGYMPEFCLPGMGRDLYSPAAPQTA